jgi:hypothetical protein
MRLLADLLDTIRRLEAAGLVEEAETLYFNAAEAATLAELSAILEEARGLMAYWKRRGG